MRFPESTLTSKAGTRTSRRTVRCQLLPEARTVAEAPKVGRLQVRVRVDTRAVDCHVMSGVHLWHRRTRLPCGSVRAEVKKLAGRRCFVVGLVESRCGAYVEFLPFIMASAYARYNYKMSWNFVDG